MTQLNEGRDKSNIDFYNDHVSDEYSMLSSEQDNSVAKLVANKTKALGVQRARTMQRAKSFHSVVELDNGLSKQDKQVPINVNLAHKDPLKFIDTILEHHDALCDGECESYSASQET